MMGLGASLSCSPLLLEGPVWLEAPWGRVDACVFGSSTWPASQKVHGNF